MEIFWILSGVTILGLVGFGLQIFAVCSYLKTNQSPGRGRDSIETFPPISILKPLSGLDDNLFDNLESFCRQDYPKYDILCSIQDPNDPAYRVVEKVKNRFPDKGISILVERCNEGLNPKVNNMLPAYRHARYPYILISDSNVMVERDYLRKNIRFMDDPNIGLVTNLIRGVRAKTIGSLFENLHLNSFILGNVCFLKKFLDIPCVVGKSMLMRRSDLEAIGGLKAFKDVLAEDHFIGEKIRERGQQVILSNHMIGNVNEYWGVKRFFNRHLRWGKMRWKILGYKYVTELIGNPVLLSLSSLFFEGPSKRALLFIASVGLVKSVGDFYMGQKINAQLHPLAYVLSPLKDLLMGFVWFMSIANDTVVWRGKRYLIGENTVLFPCPQKGIWTWRYRLLDRIRVRTA
ncbi:MAG: glycosyltransferase [Syntrophaceae bacterium]|nr:glycosyltransferase [Syntrophaceae bacterium]